MNNELWQEISEEYFNELKNSLQLTKATGDDLCFYIKNDGAVVIKKRNTLAGWKHYRRKDISVL